MLSGGGVDGYDFLIFLYLVNCSLMKNWQQVEWPRWSFYLILGLRSDLNIFVVEHELLSLEDALEQYMARGQNPILEKFVKDLEQTKKFAENADLKETIRKRQKVYEDNEYRKNMGEFLRKMEMKMIEILKEVNKNYFNIYLTNEPFEKAEIKMKQIKNDQKQMTEMSDLKKILGLLIVESKMEILRKEFDIEGYRFARVRFRLPILWSVFFSKHFSFYFNILS